MQASTDLNQRLYPVLENLSPHSYYVRIRPVPLSGVARTITLSLYPLVNMDINKDGLLLGVEIIDTGPYKPSQGGDDERHDR
jgi:hypothetical protein